MLLNRNGHENSSKEMTRKEDFSHDVCREIVLEVVAHCVKESTWKNEDKYQENNGECRIKNDRER